MEKRKWIAPNDLITLKKQKRPRFGKDSVRLASSPQVSSSSRTCHLRVQEDIGESGSDWQLKSKVRILCDQDFSWLDSSKPQHEARALAAVNKSEDEDILVLFHQSLLVWIHPFFPFLELFPPMGPQVSNTQQTALVLTDTQLGVVKEHWSSSFHSLFELLHNGHCAYFYLCANCTTILFLGKSEVLPHGLALLSPTTSGFRRALARQGVEFSLPLCSARETHKMEEAEGADRWLKEMVAPDTPLSLIPQIEGPSGNLANSLVAVEGRHFRALVNFILNTKLLVSSEGVRAGIPPTLLASAPFLGATASTLKVKRSRVMEASSQESTLTNRYCLDITGPILPRNTQLLKKTLEQLHPHYTSQTHDINGTSAFNQYFTDKKN